MTIRNVKIVLLVAPILLFVFFILQAANNQNKGTAWTVPVSGYDPRDLLRGHYVQFNYDWNWVESEESCIGDHCCLCLNKSGDVYYNPQASLIVCDKKQMEKQCESHIKGRGYLSFDNQNLFVSKQNINRFYVPENHAKELDSMLIDEGAGHQFDIVLNVTGNGRAFIKSMNIDNQDFSLWLKKLGN